MENLILEETHNQIVIIQLNRPKKRNALNYEMIDEISAKFSRLNTDSDCKAIVLAGSGTQAFCSGMDLFTLKNLSAKGATDWVERLFNLYNSIRMFDKPCVGAINGIAAGAGFQIALLTDIRIGCDKTKMGQPEINVGLPSILGPNLMFPSLGLSKVSELTYSGNIMSAKELDHYGLISQMVDQSRLKTEALNLAEKLVNKSPIAFKLTKQSLRELSQSAFDLAFRQASKAQFEAFSSGESQEYIKRVLQEKRK